MKILRIFTIVVALAATRLPAQDYLDQVEDALTLNASNGEIRARLSGLLDLEAFGVDQPPPGLIDTRHHVLGNPRLTLFLDAQFGNHAYFFVQTRADRGFDPNDEEIRVRLDEYALRINPWEADRFNIQIGKFATVVGNFVPRHLSWENPFVTAPLPYENLTAISDRAAPRGGHYFVYSVVLDDNNYGPVIWGPSYATGGSIAGRVGKFNYAFEIKNAALASRPQSWDVTNIGFENPTFSGRLGFRPNEAWNFGFSASDGPYFRPEAEPTLPRGTSFGDYRQFLLGQDISFALHHLQLWAEFYEVRFQVPRIGDVDTFAYYLEAKYKFTPQFFAALRWNQQLFSTIPTGPVTSDPWGHDLWRVDTSIAYRFTAHTQLKLQYSFQDANADSRKLAQMLAVQFTVRF
jgi:hypothetical protein